MFIISQEHFARITNIKSNVLVICMNWNKPTLYIRSFLFFHLDNSLIAKIVFGAICAAKRIQLHWMHLLIYSQIANSVEIKIGTKEPFVSIIAISTLLKQF